MMLTDVIDVPTILNGSRMVIQGFCNQHGIEIDSEECSVHRYFDVGTSNYLIVTEHFEQTNYVRVSVCV